MRHCDWLLAVAKGDIELTQLPKITSYSQHALEQIAGRDGGIGVSKSAMDSAWVNPLKIEYIPSKYGTTFRYTGSDAVIVVNKEGRVVTGWDKLSAGTAK